MRPNPFRRNLLIPVAIILLAGTLALAEENNIQPSPYGDAAISDPASQSSVQTPNSISQPDSPAANGTNLPSEKPKDKKLGKKHKPKKAAQVLDPIQEGKTLFETRCNTCHAVPNTNVHTRAEWPECIRRMAARSYLRDAEVGMIIQFLDHELQPSTPEGTDSSVE